MPNESGKVRCVWRRGWLERTNQDITYAVRSFRRTPAFTAVGVLTLALGIGATTAIIGIVDDVFLNPLPYSNANRLVIIREKLTRNPSGPPLW